ncbi:type II toxin-antitoxin system VapC family toxin [soil metagenome]
MILVDSNVLLDVFGADERWGRWSSNALEVARRSQSTAINQIVYAEVSAGFGRIEDLDARLSDRLYQRLELPWEAAFLAGRAFVQYRRSGGKRRSPLPDFYIGAHAAVARMPLLTRDPQRYRA